LIFKKQDGVDVNFFMQSQPNLAFFVIE